MPSRPRTPWRGGNGSGNASRSRTAGGQPSYGTCKHRTIGGRSGTRSCLANRPRPSVQAAHEVMERRALITVLERSNRRLVEDHQRFVYAALERPEQHVGEHAAAALAQTSEQDVHPLLVGHLIRSACSFRIPDSASGSAGTYLALTLATCPYKRVDQSPVLLPVVARHVKQDAACA